MKEHCLLYGANGYTGQLIARRAKELGVPLVLAGRSESKVRSLAEELGMEYLAFGLGDLAVLEEKIRPFVAVLHAAGPFIHTARPMMEACMRAKTHYLDITGEIAVFEMAAAMGHKAKEAGIMMMPGTGFDVVPTDCTALYLKKALPDAHELQLAFTSVGSRVSHGTATTMAENLGEGGAVRQNGKIIKVPMGHKTLEVPFTAEKQYFTMTIPWGDVSTAYYSTGIPNIEVYFGIHPRSYRFIKLQRYFNWFLRSSLARNYVKRRIEKAPAGPNEQQLQKGRSLVWGKARNRQGEERSVRLSTPEGYQLTAITSLLIAQKVLHGDAPAGFQTPAKAYGEDLIMEVESVVREGL